MLPSGINGRTKPISMRVSFIVAASLLLCLTTKAQAPLCQDGTFTPWDGFPVNCHDVVEYQGGVYGLDAWVTGTLTRYDVATGQTTVLSAPPFTLGDLPLAVSNGKLYTFGGYTTGFGTTSEAHAYDIATGSWEPLPDMPVSLIQLSAVALGDAIYITGGTFGVTTRHYLRFDIPSSTYTVLATPDDYLASKLVAFQGLIYSIGGQRYAPSYVTTDLFHVYDPASDTWQGLPNMPFERSWAAAAVWGSYLYVFGGSTATGGANPDVTWYDEYYAYDFAAGQWLVADAPMPALPKYAAAIAVGDTVYVISNDEGEGATFKYSCEGPQSPCISSTPVSYSGLDASYTTLDAAVILVGSPVGGVFIGPGMSGSTFDPAAAGEGTHGISYTYLDTNNCVNTYSLCTSVSIGMGLEDPARMMGGIRVFPNPNHGQFTVELELQGLVSLQVFDGRGRQVHNEVFQANGSRTQRTLDLSGLAKGGYTVQVRNAGAVVTQQVIIE